MLTINQIFDLAIKMAVKADPRGEKGIKEYLNAVGKEYEDAKPKDKRFFDSEKLTNPYADSRVHLDDGKTAVKRVLVGIDIDGAEIILASQLNERGKKIDLVMAHHPLGRGLADLHSVMDMQVEIFLKAGVPVHVAEKVMAERIKEVGRGLHPINHSKIIDLARLLGINLLNVHTPTDNLVYKYLNDFLIKKKVRIIRDVIDALLELPEYEAAARLGAGPKIFSGDPGHKVGRYILEMTGGTNPSEKVYKELSRYGISTTVGMHMKEPARELASKHHMNVVIAGHMASDSLGMNLFLDELEKRGVEIVPCGGLIRVSRVKQR
ncbi:MAG: NGG1p interacting factor NIF3 [Patescibacteria group bacterium]